MLFLLKKQTKQPNKKNQTYIRKKAQKTHAQLKRVTKKPTKHVKQRLKKPDLLKTPLAANSSAPTWFTARVSGLQPQFFQWNLPTYSIETTRAITHLRSVGSSPPIHEEVEDLEEVARLAQRRMNAGRHARCGAFYGARHGWQDVGVKNGPNEWFNQQQMRDFLGCTLY